MGFNSGAQLGGIRLEFALDLRYDLLFVASDLEQ